MLFNLTQGQPDVLSVSQAHRYSPMASLWDHNDSTSILCYSTGMCLHRTILTAMSAHHLQSE